MGGSASPTTESKKMNIKIEITKNDEVVFRSESFSFESAEQEIGKAQRIMEELSGSNEKQENEYAKV